MLDFFHKQLPIVIGLDISSGAIKLLELARDAKKYTVQNYAILPLAQGAVVEKSIKDSEQVIKVIQETVKKSRTKSSQVALAVPSSSVINKVVQMNAHLSEDDMEAQIHFEADKYIPYPLEEVSLDFSVIGTAKKDPDLVDVLLVASRTENVDIRLAIAQEAGLEVKIVDVESYAVERACNLLAKNLPDQGIDKTIAVIDIGQMMTTITVLHNMSVVFTREELFGCHRLIEDIMQHYNMKYEEAKLAEAQHTLPQDYEMQVLAPYRETATVQVRRALQFFFSTTQYGQIDHIILAGGAVLLADLADTIAERIGVPVSVANPFEAMTVAKHIDKSELYKHAPMMLISCGLAMRSFK